MKILNLYAGLGGGGNRKFWNGNVTAVENNLQISCIYKRLYPKDNVITDDAHQYLLNHYKQFDFIWSSPPCQSHSRMNKATRHESRRYPDFNLYQEIFFLKHFYHGKWVVENVMPYYTPLITPNAVIGRHLFWSNFNFSYIESSCPPDFINKCNVAGKKEMMDWLGIHFDENVYVKGNHCPAQVLRNCVHPEIGRSIMNSALVDQRLEQIDLGDSVWT